MLEHKRHITKYEKRCFTWTHFLTKPLRGTPADFFWEKQKFMKKVWNTYKSAQFWMVISNMLSILTAVMLFSIELCQMLINYAKKSISIFWPQVSLDSSKIALLCYQMIPHTILHLVNHESNKTQDGTEMALIRIRP